MVEVFKRLRQIGMYKRAFLDANIFIDMENDERSSCEDSSKIFKSLLENRVTIYTSCDLITTIYYILAKKDRQKALASIEKINRFCNIIEFSNKEVDSTCKLMREDKNFRDLEDTMQYVLALKENCDLIISNDKNFKSIDIKLLSAKEFLKEISHGS